MKTQIIESNSIGKTTISINERAGLNIFVDWRSVGLVCFLNIFLYLTITQCIYVSDATLLVLESEVWCSC